MHSSRQPQSRNFTDPKRDLLPANSNTFHSLIHTLSNSLQKRTVNLSLTYKHLFKCEKISKCVFHQQH